jgi:threonine/homoserine/homoserine lactone efflux protein
MRERLTANRMAWINRVSGLIIVTFGALAIFKK